MAMTPQGWSISALAVELGKDRRSIAAACADLEPCARSGKADLYRMADVIAALGAGIKPKSFDDAKTRKMAADAELAELELQRQRGEIVPIKEVVATVSAEYAATRAKLLAIPTKLAPRIALETEEAACRALLTREITEALNELIGAGPVRVPTGEPEAPTDPDC